MNTQRNSASFPALDAGASGVLFPTRVSRVLLPAKSCLQGMAAGGEGFGQLTTECNANVVERELAQEELLQPWEFLRRLPHKYGILTLQKLDQCFLFLSAEGPRHARLIRDVGFVIVGPPLLLNSHEFPTVTSNMLGGCRDNWPRTAKWLQELDIDSIKRWFSSGKCSTRLGDHYAKCVEFVLRFSPGVQLECLFYSQQVLESVYQTTADETGIPSTISSGNQLDEETAISELEPRKKELMVDTESNPGISSVESADDKYAKRRSKKILRRLQRKQYVRSIVNTIGEFDFLFRLKASTETPRNEDEIIVQHWEVSVKYLLYVGPWEAFGMKTPESAKWTRLKVSSIEKHGLESCEEHCHSSRDEFLGCFLGPHVGETLADRKQRLKSQLTLSSKPSALKILKSLFGSSNPNQVMEVDTNSNGTSDSYSEDYTAIRVCSKALLQGYLFYEPQLWGFLKASCSTTEDLCSGTSYLNSMHWKGWWMHVEDFATFSGVPPHSASRWYIVPKKEWLSPVLICETDEERWSGMLTVDDLLGMADTVAEEAAEKQMPRMRRFLVAEMQVDTDLGATSVVWAEVSRGFLVEDTWPDTKTYSPHGFVATWSPT